MTLVETIAGCLLWTCGIGILVNALGDDPLWTWLRSTDDELTRRDGLTSIKAPQPAAENGR